MKALLRTLAMLILVAPFTAGAAQAEADAIVGTWNTAENKSRVEIFEADGRYHGRIVALKEPLYPADPAHPDYVEELVGQPKTDRRNPDESQRDRPIVGMLLMTGFQYDGDNVWSGGTIYDPESGKTYKCRMTLTDEGELKVRGYVGVSLFGRTTVWTR